MALARATAGTTPPLSARRTSFPALEEYLADLEIGRLLPELYGG